MGKVGYGGGGVGEQPCQHAEWDQRVPPRRSAEALHQQPRRWPALRQPCSTVQRPGPRHGRSTWSARKGLSQPSYLNPCGGAVLPVEELPRRRAFEEAGPVVPFIPKQEIDRRNGRSAPAAELRVRTRPSKGKPVTNGLLFGGLSTMAPGVDLEERYHGPEVLERRAEPLHEGDRARARDADPRSLEVGRRWPLAVLFTARANDTSGRRFFGVGRRR